MKNAFLILICCFSLNLSAQLLFGDKKDTYYYLDIKGDSARLEVFQDQLYAIYKIDEITLNKGLEQNVLFFGSNHKIVRIKGKMNLLYRKALTNETLKIELLPAPKDNRESLRKEAYYCKKSKELANLQDSLAGPSHRSTFSIERNPDNSYSSAEYIRFTDQLMDTLTKQIISAADKTALAFYRDIDSIYTLTPNEIYTLLNKAKYEFHYGGALVYATAIARPDILISFVDKNSPNKLFVLKAIRDHKYHDAIISKVKAYPVDSYAKSEILKQKRNKSVRSKAGKGAFVALIVAEVGLIAALIIAALK